MIEPKNLDGQTEATMYDLFNYFCSKVDFGHTNLDNAAICAMDTLFRTLDREKKIRFR